MMLNDNITIEHLQCVPCFSLKRAIYLLFFIHCVLPISPWSRIMHNIHQPCLAVI